LGAPGTGQLWHEGSFQYRVPSGDVTTAHSTREKLILQKSPAFGGTLAAVFSASFARGSATSTDQNLVPAAGLLIVPSTYAAVCIVPLPPMGGR
jgi:hypothetical protein